MRRALSSIGLLCLLSAGSALAQIAINPPPSLLSFQGRLARPNGTPVADGSYNLTLSLWDSLASGSKRWEQTLTNVPVKNGTFAAVLNLTNGFTPGNTLDTTLNNATFLQIQIGADAPLAPRQQLLSTAYALKAATVPDGSITAAKLTADARSLTGAAGGDLTGGFPTPQIRTGADLLTKVSGTLLVVPNLAATTAEDQSQTTVTAVNINSAWQSFTPGTTATLVELGIYCGTTGADVPVTLSLYAGEGTGSAALVTLPITVSSALGMQNFPINLPVTAGQVYTWSVGSNNNLRFGYTGGNPYAGGLSNLGSTFDYAFRTVRKVNAGPATQINATANLYMVGLNSILGDAQTAPMITRQYNPFTSGAYNGIGRFGLYQEPNILFLGIPGTDIAGSSLRLGSWAEDGTRSDLMTLQNSGNVGIGTDTPTQKLDVAGNGAFTGSLSAASATIPTVNGNTLFNNLVSLTQNQRIGISPADTFTYNTLPLGHYSLGWYNDSQNSASGATAWLSSYGGIKMFTTGASRISVTPAGRVGIGIDAPTATLDVNGTMRYRGNSPAAGNVIVALNANGDLGWSNPAAALGAAGGDLSGTFPNPTIAANAVTGAKIADGTITSADLANFAVTNVKLLDGSVTSSKLATDAASLSKVSGGLLTSNGSNITLTTSVWPASIINSSSTAGTWQQLINTTTGGHNWSLISSGSGNGEGAGKLLFNDQTVGGATRMLIDNNGRIGIGTFTPQANLHVAGSVVTANGTGNYFNYIFGPNESTHDIGSANNVIAYFEGSTVASSNVISMSVSSWSDARAKTVLGRSSGLADLDLLNQIQITDYKWIDERQDHGTIHKKVIAQEVEKVLPSAVGRMTRAIPSVYAKASQVQYDAKSRLLTLTTAKAHDFKPGDKVEVYTDNGDLSQAVVLAVSSPFTFTVASEKGAAAAFVYGKWVNDYRMVDYDAISMLNVSATQELHRQLRTKDAEISELKAQLANVLKRLDAVEANSHR